MLLNEYDILSELSNQVSLLMYNGIEQESNIVLRLNHELAKIDSDFEDLYFGEFVKKGISNVVWKAWINESTQIYFRKDISNYTQWIEVHNGKQINFYEYLGCSFKERCIFLVNKSNDSIYKLFENKIKMATSCNSCFFEGTWHYRLVIVFFFISYILLI